MRWRLAVVVVLGLTAGCTTLGGGGETTTLTPAPVPSEPPESGPGSTVAPGVWADGQIDAETLADAHRTAMRNRSFVWRTHRNFSATVANVTRQTTTRRLLVVENRTRYYRDVRSPADPWADPGFTRHSEYSNGTARFIRRDALEWYEERYYRAPVTPRGPALTNATAAPIERYLDVETVTVTTIANDSGPRFRLVGRQPAGTWGDSIRNYTVRALVTPDGLVRSVAVSFTFAESGSVERVRYEASFERLGDVTVSPPDWLPAARNQSADDGRATP